MKRRLFIVLVICLVALTSPPRAACATPEYSIKAIRYATLPDIPVAALVVNGPKDKKIDAAFAIWLIQGGGHNILFDSGFHRDIDPADVTELVRINTEGRLHLVNGDNVEILPGIRAYTGGRHTYASQYLRVDGKEPYVLASDNCYLYLNLTAHLASGTFGDADHAANIANQARMIELAGSPDRVVPGHDPLQFERYHAAGRVAQIR